MAWRDVWFTSPDGLRLYARDHAGEASRVPLLCLSGLTRNSRDFEPLVAALGDTRRVIAKDYRGRGRSQYADGPQLYRPDLEAADALALLDTLGIERAAVIGTSRGGIVAMIIASLAPQKLAGILFNDIGPVIDKAGLLRIATYVGKAASFTDWAGAVAALKRTHDGFETLTEEEWLRYAHRIFRDEGGLPSVDYDLRLAETFSSSTDIEASPPPDLWPLFDAMGDMPLSVLRGEHSDLLSPVTVAEMQRRRPGLEATVVRNRGHVPFLDEPDSLAAIARWLARVDAAQPLAA